jgi:uncharacterized protein
MASKSTAIVRQFHAGEIAVQQRAGHAFPGRIKDVIPPVAAEFLTQHLVCTLAGCDRQGRMWTTMLGGPAGFMTADDEHTLHVRARPLETDPLHQLLTTGGHVGTIIMDSRRRMRVNGVLEPTRDGFAVRAEQVFSNCGRYISERHPVPLGPRPAQVSTGAALTPGQAALIRTADTFLIGTRHPDGDADASHRGGNPGFVHIDGPDALRWPDYDGNNMYATLGNLTLDPRVGLLFLDWAEGTLLQVSGRAELDWSPQTVAQLPGALRVIHMRVDAVQESVHAVPMRWTPAALSRFNPPRAAAGTR